MCVWERRWGTEATQQSQEVRQAVRCTEVRTAETWHCTTAHTQTGACRSSCRGPCKGLPPSPPPLVSSSPHSHHQTLTQPPPPRHAASPLPASCPPPAPSSLHQHAHVHAWTGGPTNNTRMRVQGKEQVVLVSDECGFVETCVLSLQHTGCKAAETLLVELVHDPEAAAYEGCPRHVILVDLCWRCKYSSTAAAAS